MEAEETLEHIVILNVDTETYELLARRVAHLREAGAEDADASLVIKQLLRGSFADCMFDDCTEANSPDMLYCPEHSFMNQQVPTQPTPTERNQNAS